MKEGRNGRRNEKMRVKRSGEKEREGKKGRRGARYTITGVGHKTFSSALHFFGFRRCDFAYLFASLSLCARYI